MRGRAMLLYLTVEPFRPLFRWLERVAETFFCVHKNVDTGNRSWRVLCACRPDLCYADQHQLRRRIAESTRRRQGQQYQQARIVPV